MEVGEDEKVGVGAEETRPIGLFLGCESLSFLSLGFISVELPQCFSETRNIGTKWLGENRTPGLLSKLPALDHKK